jgi:ATP-binding cassette subfamily D (ALD) long-chain fatty acid import protein
VFPRLISKESLMLLLHTSFLVGRTFLSILVANLDGAIVKTLVGRDGKGFLYYLLVWILLGNAEVDVVVLF